MEFFLTPSVNCTKQQHWLNLVSTFAIKLYTNSSLHLAHRHLVGFGELSKTLPFVQTRSFVLQLICDAPKQFDWLA